MLEGAESQLVKAAWIETMDGHTRRDMSQSQLVKAAWIEIQ